MNDLKKGFYYPYPSTYGKDKAIKVWDGGRWNKERQKEAENIEYKGNN